MSVKNILVTGIGGNVGQGIMRNIRKLNLSLLITGCDIGSFTAGNHLCDYFYQVPYAYDELYIETIKNIIREKNINLIIPSTDFEVYYLALYRNELNAVVAASNAETALIYLDKYKTFLHHQKNNIPFASSVLPSAYNGVFKKMIAKPRKGRGSRGIHINPSSLEDFSDEDYLVQELIEGDEITTAFYVTKSNKLLGSITMQRKLENGFTSECKVVKHYDNEIIPILNKIIENSEIRGSANLQSIVTSDRKIVPFEINCRISGTNSIRSNFGFDDVKYTIQEYLLNEPVDEPVIKKGLAIRIMMDVIYPEAENTTKLTHNSMHYIF